MSQDYAAVDLGETGTPVACEPSVDVPPWQRRAVAVGLFAFGLLIGVLGWQARLDNAVTIDLVASDIGSRSETEPDEPRLQHFGLSVFNGGPHELTLLDVVLPGWEPPTVERADRSLRPAEWTSVDVLAAPSCDVPIPVSLVATVRRDSEDVVVTVALPPDQPTLSTYEEACAGADLPLRVTSLQSRQWLNSRSDELLVTPIGLAGSIADTTLVAVSASAPGFRGAVPTLPAPLQQARRVDVVWQITDCAGAAGVRVIEFEITVDSVASRRTETVESADSYLLYLLGNFAAREC